MIPSVLISVLALSSVAMACGPIIGGGIPLAGQTIADNCQCTKTIVRPQLRQQVIEIPTTNRIVQNTVTPVVEAYNYNTRNSPCGTIVESGLPLGLRSLRGLGVPTISALNGVQLGLPLASRSCGIPLGAGPCGLGGLPLSAGLGLPAYGPLGAIGAGYPLGAGFPLGAGVNDVLVGGSIGDIVY